MGGTIINHPFRHDLYHLFVGDFLGVRYYPFPVLFFCLTIFWMPKGVSLMMAAAKDWETMVSESFPGRMSP